MTFVSPEPDPSPEPLPAAAVAGDSAHAVLAADLAAAAAGLADLDRAPIGEHVARYDEVHAALQDALTSIDGV